MDQATEITAAPDYVPAYQCDASGWLRCVTQAFASPLEPGVYHVPAGATLTPPPAEPWPEGTAPRLVSGEWVLQVPPPPAPRATATQSPMDRLAEFLRENPDVAALVAAGAQSTS